MRQRIITLGIVLAGIFTAQAQEVKFGVKAGLNLSDLSIDIPSRNEVGNLIRTDYNTGMRAGFHIGAFAEVGLSDTWFVEAGVAYSFQGANLKSGESTITEIATGALVHYDKINFESDSYIKAQMLNIPVWIKYDIAGFRPKVGFNLGFMTNVETRIAFEGKVAKYKGSPDKNFDFGLGVGAEYNLPMGLFFDATFNLGLTKLSQKIEEETEMTYKNRVFQIGVGYKF